MDHKFFIILIIGIIVLIQCWIFWETLKKIKLFKTIFPPSIRFNTVKVYIPEILINKLGYEELYSDLMRYSVKPLVEERRSFTIQVDEISEFHQLSKLDEVLRRYRDRDYRIMLTKNNRTVFADKSDYERLINSDWSISEKNIELIEVTLIHNTVPNNVVLEKIIKSVNIYLLRNKGAVSDFNLVKDVVERNCDSEDEQINTLLPIPLYLGLMGTMLGIIVGVGYMAINGFSTFLGPNLVTGGQGSPNDDNGIIVLMGAVGVAMVSSLIGLLLTTTASGWFYKGAKSKVEGLKNDFYTFIQTELLPSISNSATNSIINLQTNLLKFNEGFTSNVSRFDNLLTQILASFKNQMGIVQDLKDIDLVKLARLNIDVLKELKNSTNEFEKFNQYIHQVNALVSNASELNTTLKSDLADIENRKYTVQQAFTKVNDSYEKGLEILKENTDERLKEAHKAAVTQQDLFEKHLEDTRKNLLEILQAEKDKYVEQYNQNQEILIELKKHSELRQVVEKVEFAIASQNKVLNEQNKTLGSFSQAADELNKSVKKLSTLQTSPSSGPLVFPPTLKYLGYSFVVTGIAASMTVMVFLGGKFLSPNEQQIKEIKASYVPTLTNDSIALRNEFIKMNKPLNPGDSSPRNNKPNIPDSLPMNAIK
jgi:hypothetical protein